MLLEVSVCVLSRALIFKRLNEVNVQKSNENKKYFFTMLSTDSSHERINAQIEANNLNQPSVFHGIDHKMLK